MNQPAARRSSAVRREGTFTSPIVRQPLLPLAVSLVAGLLLLPGLAQAGEYGVEACRTPSGAPAPTAGWGGFSNGAYNDAVNGCADGRPMRAFLSGAVVQGSDARAGWTFTSPADTTISGFRIWRSARLGAGRDFGSPLLTLEYPNPTYDADNVRDNFSNGRSSPVAIGDESSPISAPNLVAPDAGHPARGTHLYYAISCGGGSTCPRQTDGGSTGEVRIHRAEVVLQDPFAPTSARPGGSLVNASATGSVESGRLTVEVNALDRGAGLLQARLRVDGVDQQVQGLGRGDECTPLPGTANAFTAVVPCPPSAAVAFDLDAGQLATGAHDISVVVQDAAGNVATVFSGRLSSRRATRPVVGGLKVRLRATPRRLRNGQSVLFHGVLRGQGGGGLLVAMEVRVGGSWRPFALTRARDRGRFRYRYRFTRTTQTQTYAFRARVARQASGARRSALSNRIRVRVRR